MDFEGFAKPTVFRENYHKPQKRMSRKVSWKNMILELVFDAKMGGLEKQKQAFRIIRVAEYNLLVFWYHIVTICFAFTSLLPPLWYHVVYYSFTTLLSFCYIYFSYTWSPHCYNSFVSTLLLRYYIVTTLLPGCYHCTILLPPHWFLFLIVEPWRALPPPPRKL